VVNQDKMGPDRLIFRDCWCCGVCGGATRLWIDLRVSSEVLVGIEGGEWFSTTGCAELTVNLDARSGDLSED
jgi:hypothetical protein